MCIYTLLGISSSGKDVFNNDKSTSETRCAAARPDFYRLVRGASRAGGRALGRRRGPGADRLRGLGRRRDTGASALHGGAHSPAEDSGGMKAAGADFSAFFADFSARKSARTGNQKRETGNVNFDRCSTFRDPPLRHAAAGRKSLVHIGADGGCLLCGGISRDVLPPQRGPVVTGGTDGTHLMTRDSIGGTHT